MPTYEYQCSACGHAFEKFHSITAAPIKLCPQCKKRKVKRLIGTGAGLIFKGSGFYITDYRSDSYKSAAKGDQPAAASTTAAKTDSAPASSSGGGSSAPAPAASKPEKSTATKAVAAPSK